MVDALQDEVDDFDRRVHDAKALGHLRERVAEELVVEFDDDLLLALGALDALGTHLHRGIELLQGARFLVEAMLLECIEDSLHCARHRVLGSEAVA